MRATTTGSDKLGESFAIGLGSKLLSKAAGIHLDHESTELARRVTDNLPWGPGPGSVDAMPAPQIVMMPEIKMPEPPSFGYMDWEGKRDFTAVVYSLVFDKNRNETFTMEMPIAVAANRMRMDMDMSKMIKGRQHSFSAQQNGRDRPRRQKDQLHTLPRLATVHGSYEIVKRLRKNPGSKRPGWAVKRSAST